MSRSRTDGHRAGGQDASATLFTQLASHHNSNRNFFVTRVLYYIDLLMNEGIVPHSTAIVKRAAKWQSYSASGGHQAAHPIPCALSLRINGRSVEITRVCPDEDMKKSLRLLFGKVDDLASVFNKTDTMLEAFNAGNGLCDAFAAAANEIGKAPSHRAPSTPLLGGRVAGLNSVNVARCFQLYRQRAITVFGSKLQELEQQTRGGPQPRAPVTQELTQAVSRQTPMDASASAGDDSAEYKRQQHLIVQGYLSSANTSKTGSTTPAANGVMKHLTSEMAVSHADARRYAALFQRY